MTEKKAVYKSADPLVALVKEKNRYVLYDAYHRLAVLCPQYFKNYCKIKSVKIKIDGKIKNVKIPGVIYVDKSFEVLSRGKRVNIIGYSSKGNEAGIEITKKMLIKKYAVDKKGNIYRVEIYDGHSFCGMFLADFKGEK
jgi:hypothetical protein